jgi:hypothetical protein
MYRISVSLTASGNATYASHLFHVECDADRVGGILTLLSEKFPEPTYALSVTKWDTIGNEADYRQILAAHADELARRQQAREDQETRERNLRTRHEREEAERIEKTIAYRRENGMPVFTDVKVGDQINFDIQTYTKLTYKVKGVFARLRVASIVSASPAWLTWTDTAGRTWESLSSPFSAEYGPNEVAFYRLVASGKFDRYGEPIMQRRRGGIVRALVHIVEGATESGRYWDRNVYQAACVARENAEKARANAEKAA